MAFGCAQSKKPLPPSPEPGPQTVPNPGPARKPLPDRMPTTSPELHRIAVKLAAEAEKVAGVRDATVVLSGTNAYVGLDLDRNIQGKTTDQVKEEAARRVKKADRRLTDVYVSTDADTVTRIREVARGIAEGRPVSGFSRELAEIGRRLLPETKR